MVWEGLTECSKPVASLPSTLDLDIGKGKKRQLELDHPFGLEAEIFGSGCSFSKRKTLIPSSLEAVPASITVEDCGTKEISSISSSSTSSSSSSSPSSSFPLPSIFSPVPSKAAKKYKLQIASKQLARSAVQEDMTVDDSIEYQVGD